MAPSILRYVVNELPCGEFEGTPGFCPATGGFVTHVNSLRGQSSDFAESGQNGIMIGKWIRENEISWLKLGWVESCTILEPGLLFQAKSEDDDICHEQAAI